MQNLLELLRDYSNRRHGDTMNMVDVMLHLAQGQQMQHNARRMNAQVDMHLRERCGDSYQPPTEDEMGNNLLNNVFIGNDAVNQLAAALNEGIEKGSPAESANGKPAAASSSTATSTGSKKPLLKTALQTAALVGGTGLATGLVMNYLADDTDTDTRYDIQAVEFDPNLNPQPSPI